MPLIQKQVVELNAWLTMDELLDLITISQMTPGPITINAATFVGIRVGGIPGAIVATAGCVTPSCIIVLTLAFFYFKYKNLTVVQSVLAGLRPAAVALIASASLSILSMSLFIEKPSFKLSEGFFNAAARVFTSLNGIAVLVFLLAFLVLKVFKKNPILVIFGSGLVYLGISTLLGT